MKKRLFSACLAIFFLVAPWVSLSAFVSPMPEVPAGATILADLNTGDVLFSHHMYERTDPAAATLIMTGLLAVEALDRGEVLINDLLTVSSDALLDVGPTNIGLTVGEQMTFESLLFAMMLGSADDAANVIAEHLGGSIPTFVQMMNDRARMIGATSTNFSTPNSRILHDHYTTAYDILLITRQAMHLPRFVDLVSVPQRAHPATNERPAGMFLTTNPLIAPASPHYFSYAYGVVSGFSDVGATLVSTAARDNVALVSIMLGAPAPYGVDSTAHFDQVIALYNWAFLNFSYTEIVPANTVILRVPISLGDGAEYVNIRPQAAVSALMPGGFSGFDAMQQDVTLFHEQNDETLYAPLNIGDVLGEVVLHYEGRSFGPIVLVAGENIRVSRTAFLRNEVRSTFDSVWVWVVIIVMVLLVLLYAVYVIRHSMIRRRRRRERLNRR